MATKGSKAAGDKVNALERDDLLHTLKARFEKNPRRHAGIEWAEVDARLKGNTAALRSLRGMEESGGEPDVIGHDDEGRILFCDCSIQSPKGRRSICYDREAREGRKQHAPADSAVEMAEAMGIELLTEEQYRQLQQLGEFDTTTSSWIETPSGRRTRVGPRRPRAYSTRTPCRCRAGSRSH